MSKNILHIAQNTIPFPKYDNIKIGNALSMTDDIIFQILKTYKRGLHNLVHFASELKSIKPIDTLRNDYDFVRTYIKYVLDPDGVQNIKTPSRIFWDGFADCKGYSIFLATLLFHQGFKNFGFRFVSYSKKNIYTHVYVFVKIGKETIILDAVPGIPYFNYEKPYVQKKDYTMTQIIAMSGIGSDDRKVKKVFNTGSRMPDEMSEGELTLWIARDRMITEKEIVEKIQGIGSLKAEKYQDSIDMLEDAIEAVQNATVNGIGNTDVDILDELADIADMAVAGVYSNAAKIVGIGKSKRNNKRKEKKEERKKIRSKKKELRKKGDKKSLKEYRKSHKSKTGKFLQKVGKTVKKGVKAFAKVLTAPQRAFVKVLLEVSLPKAAPVFLYLFVNDEKLIAKLPSTAVEKRKKAVKIADFIVNTIGMKRAHFMGIVRNGIMKEYGKSPEKVIAEQMKGVSGIGFVAALGAAFKVLVSIISKLGHLFKKKPDIDLDEESFVPQPGSEDEMSADIANEITEKNNDDFGDDDADENSSDFSNGGKKIWNSLK